MKKTILTLAAIALAFVSCQKIDSLLDTTNWTAKDTSTFPVNEEDALQLVNSLYSTLNDTYRDPENCNYYKNLVASDDVFGGGSESSIIAQSSDRLLETTDDDSQSNWERSYKGIFRCNYALEVLPEMDDALFTTYDKNWLIGQAHFMRAWYNWELAEKFETFPLILTSNVVNTPRSTVDEIYTAITNDLLDAITLIPSNFGYTRDDGYVGRATKYAAEALLGRVWLFYTGFYGKSDMCGVSKADVIKYLEDCRDNSKFGLENDPREIWPCTNEYSSGFAYGTDFNTYASKNNLHWVGNQSKETIWGIHFTYASQVSWNRIPEYCTFRNAAKAPDLQNYPYGIGYANAPVNPKLVEAWYKDPDYGPADKRLFGSVLVANSKRTAYAYPWLDQQYVELPDFPGHDSKEVERSWFYQKKNMVVAAMKSADYSKSNIVANFFKQVNGNISSSNQFGNRNDVILIRYADVLLMIDELKQTVDGMNKLRARAGLKPYDGYTFERLQKERRYELAFENVRFQDLRRWYPKDAGKIIEENQLGGYLEFLGKESLNGWINLDGRGLAQRYSETRGFWMVSQKEINLSEGVLTQTPGFTEDFNYLYSNGGMPYYGKTK